VSTLNEEEQAIVEVVAGFVDAPLMIVGEGTDEIQRNVIASPLIARGGVTP
jgi:hypothetical protein